MSIWGKIIGGAAGFALGGPLGALLGVVAGHAIDRAHEAKAPRETAETAFAMALVVLAAKLAKADGVVTRTEIDAFKTLFRVPPEEIRHVARIFDAARADAAGYEPYAAQVATLFHDRPAVLEELLDALFRIAHADGEVTAAEITYLRDVAQIFGFSQDDFERIRAESIGSTEENPYRVLGLARTASDEEIKKTYRRLIRENHPDRLTAEGMPEDFIEVATQRMAAINAAYDAIAKERGLR